MVDRATHYQNAMNQIQERNKQGTSQAEDIPENTHERLVKAVRPFISSCVHFTTHDVPCVRFPNPRGHLQPMSNFG
jgi:hypothetical protein